MTTVVMMYVKTRRATSRKSVLDYIRDDARTFTAKLGHADQHRQQRKADRRTS